MSQIAPPGGLTAAAGVDVAMTRNYDYFKALSKIIKSLVVDYFDDFPQKNQSESRYKLIIQAFYLSLIRVKIRPLKRGLDKFKKKIELFFWNFFRILFFRILRNFFSKFFEENLHFQAF